MSACCFEPVAVKGWERRDELGNMAPYRSHPHRGGDWGVKTGSADQPIRCFHSGTVTKVYNDAALGWTVIVDMDCDDPDHAGLFNEYNHMIRQPSLKVGDKVIGGKTQIGNIGATGSALSQSGANHLHMSVCKGAVPHAVDYKLLRDPFKMIDKSTAERKVIIEAARAKAAAGG